MGINLSKRERYILITAIAVIAISILYNFILEPAIKKWSAIDNEVNARRVKLNKDIRLLERRDAIIKEYDNYAKSSRNISKVLNYIENKASTFNIRTSNIKPSQAIQDELSSEYSIELQIEGQFPDIIKFLSELIKPPAFVTIQKFYFRINPETQGLFKGSVILSKIII